MKSKGFTLIEVMIVVAMIGILAAVLVPALQDRKNRNEPKVPEVEIEVEKPVSLNDTTTECIDGIRYLFVTKDGKNFMSPKQDRWGDNERCYE